MKRLALYVFWEKNGIVRDFVTYYLNALKEVAEDITVIVNGSVSQEGLRKLREIGVDILVRENNGLDFGAWQYALQQKGWENIYQYDELILCNCSCYGPIYPFSESFQKMDSVQCDFWGFTKYPKQTKPTRVHRKANSFVEEHIQSYFIVFKHNIICSNAFKSWWESLTTTNEYLKEIACHETKMTKYFENAGYSSATIMNCKKYFENLPSDNVSLLYPVELLKEGIPLVKRKLFIDNNYFWSDKSLGHVSRDALNFIEQNTNYDSNLIWDDLLASEKFPYVKDALHLNYILPSNVTIPSKAKPQLALLCFVYYPDLCQYMMRYISKLPEYAHVFIISSREDTLNAFREALRNSSFEKIDFRLKENRGRDVSAYLIAGRDILQNYELICCIHDKKSPYLKYQSASEDFLYMNMECCLHSNEYVNNIIQLFESNPRCGLLVPPTPYYADFCTLGNEIGANLESMKLVYKLLNLSVPMHESDVVAPFGSCFWIRKRAVEPLFRHEWKYEDFPEEPLASDFTISHAIERMYPLVAQEAGFYTAWCFPDTFASLYMNNLAYRMREYNRLLYKKMDVINWKDMRRVLTKELFLKHLIGHFIKYHKYKILSKITWGDTKKYYLQKYTKYKKEKQERTS